MLRKTLFLLICLTTVTIFAFRQTKPHDTIYLFSYFKGNGEDGLHLAYSEDGFIWKALNNDQSFLAPQVGEDKLMRDPCITQGPDGEFHMVWTVSWGEKGIGYAHSKDLIRWSEQQYIPVMEHEPEARNSWAPEIYYDGRQDLYMIYWSTTIPGRFPATESTGDDGYNHRMYYTTTRNFEDFSPTKLLYDQGFNVIDGTIIREDRKYYMFLKDETRHPPEKNIRIAHSKHLEGPYSKPSAPITGDYWAEGPTAIKVNKQWIIYFDKYQNHEMGAITSEDLKNWKDISEKIQFPEGTRHGTAFQAPRKVLRKLLQAGN